MEVLYSTKAIIGEGPFYEPGTNQLLWVDINGHTVNFLNLDTKQNRWELALPHRQAEILHVFIIFFAFVREIRLPGTVGAVVPVEGSKDLVALVGRKVCLVNRETG